MPNLYDPAQIGQSVSNALMQGLEYARQAKAQQALVGYMQNPNEQSALAVGVHDPMMGMRLQDRESQRAAQMAEQQQQATERQLFGAALNGDQEARKQLAYYNSDLYIKLDDRQKAQVDQAMQGIAQQAFSILQQPEEQHGALLQQALQAMQAQGMDVSKFNLTGNPTQDLKSALAMTGQLDEWESFSQPRFQVIPEGGTMVNTRNPAAVQQFQGGQQSMPSISDAQGYNSLPPGTQYTDPQGNVRVKPGGAGGNVSGNFPG